jgi:hypothetical protein
MLLKYSALLFDTSNLSITVLAFLSNEGSGSGLSTETDLEYKFLENLN